MLQPKDLKPKITQLWIWIRKWRSDLFDQRKSLRRPGFLRKGFLNLHLILLMKMQLRQQMRICPPRKFRRLNSTLWITQFSWVLICKEVVYDFSPNSEIMRLSSQFANLKNITRSSRKGRRGPVRKKLLGTTSYTTNQKKEYFFKTNTQPVSRGYTHFVQNPTLNPNSPSFLTLTPF